MKFVFFDCDECSESSTPASTDKAARVLAKSEGFVFVNGKSYCKEHTPNKACSGRACTCGLKIDPVGWNRHAKDCPAKRARRQRKPLVAILHNKESKCQKKFW